MSTISSEKALANLGQIQKGFFMSASAYMDNPKGIVRQSNDFSRNNLNIRELVAVRILACLASTMREDDVNFRGLSVSANSVLQLTGGTDYKALKTACDKLLHCILERKLDESGGFQKYTLFSTIGYKNGVIFAKFHPDLRPFFLGLKSHFTKYDLKEFLRLPSTYSQKLFEYLKSWDDCVERIEDIETICRILCVPESMRGNYKDLRRRVLDKAYQDISNLTSLRYEWEAVKKSAGKTSPVTAIRFIFSPIKLAESQETRKKSRNKEIHDERNRLFFKSVECFKNKPDCDEPQRTKKCATCLKVRAIELPESMQGLLPEYEN